jgi:cysteate synthase
MVPVCCAQGIAQKQIQIRDLPGTFQVSDWLPTNGTYFQLPDSKLGKPFCYKGELLAQYLGLPDLYIAFRGYWPAHGRTLPTASFKNFEARASLARLVAEHRPCRQS